MLWTGSTTTPPKKQRFSPTEVSSLLDTREDAIEHKASICLLVCKDLSVNDVGVSRDTVLQKIRPGAGFETGDFVKEKLGGATVERLFATARGFAGEGFDHPAFYPSI